MEKEKTKEAKAEEEKIPKKEEVEEKVIVPEGDISDLAEKIKQKLAKALNKKANSCAGVKQTENNLWKASIEIVEEEHMPNKFDVIAVYEVLFDNKLNLKSWEKKQQRIRG